MRAQGGTVLCGLSVPGNLRDQSVTSAGSAGSWSRNGPRSAHQHHNYCSDDGSACEMNGTAPRAWRVIARHASASLDGKRHFHIGLFTRQIPSRGKVP